MKRSGALLLSFPTDFLMDHHSFSGNPSIQARIRFILPPSRRTTSLSISPGWRKETSYKVTKIGFTVPPQPQTFSPLKFSRPPKFGSMKTGGSLILVGCSCSTQTFSGSSPSIPFQFPAKLYSRFI